MLDLVLARRISYGQLRHTLERSNAIACVRLLKGDYMRGVICIWAAAAVKVTKKPTRSGLRCFAFCCWCPVRIKQISSSGPHTGFIASKGDMKSGPS